MSRPMLSKAGVVVIAALLGGGPALAAGRGGGRVSGAARSSVSMGSRNVSGNVNRNANVNRNINSNVNRTANVNRNVNRDVNFDRDIDVDVDRNYGGWGAGCCYHPVARAATATAAAVTTAAIVGSRVNSLPTSCEAVSMNGFTYQQCGSTWYQPQFMGSTVTYVVVNPPR
jgi:hypothetical protein